MTTSTYSRISPVLPHSAAQPGAARPAPAFTPRPSQPLGVYYGAGDVTPLAQFGRVIISPGAFSEAEVRWLRQCGVQVLAYLSLGEDGGPRAPWHTGERNAHWNTALVDAAHPAWLTHIYARVMDIVPVYDGLFLDTVDCSSRSLRQLKAMLRLIRLVRRWSEGKYLMMNRGFHLLHRLHGHVDAVLIEPLSTTWLGGYRAHTPDELLYTAGVVQQIRRRRLDIYALDYANTPELRQFALERADSLRIPTFVSNRELSLSQGYLGASGPQG